LNSDIVCTEELNHPEWLSKRLGPTLARTLESQPTYVRYEMY